MTRWVYKNVFLAGEMIAWFILHLTSHRSKHNSKDRRKSGEEEGIRERLERPLAFKEALHKLAALSEPEAGG